MKKLLPFLFPIILTAQSTLVTQDQGKVGPVTGGDGTVQNLRLGRDSAIVTQDAHARYQEAVVRGNVYTGTAIQITIVAANNSPLGAGGTPVVGIFNPTSSGKNAVIWRAVAATASGTPAAQPFCIWNVIPAPAGITAAGTSGVNNFTFAAAGSQMKLFSNAAWTGSSAATALRPIGGITAVAAGSTNPTVSEETAGEIVVPPGAAAGIACGNAAGTTWILSASMTWEEVTP